MSNLTLGHSGEVKLPIELCDRYGFTPERAIRIVETSSGVLLVALTDEPMSQELADELAEWQSLAAESWSAFPYEDESNPMTVDDSPEP